MAHQKTTLREVLYSVLVFSVIVGAMTWYDLLPKAPEPETTLEMRGAFYLDQGVALSAAPENQRPLLIFEGTINADSTITTADVTPVTFPQREIGLYLNMTAVPSALSPLYDAFLAQIKRWEVEGNIVADLILHYETDTPDWAAFGAMINEFRKMTHLSYRINLSARPEWFKDNKQAQTEIQNIQQNISFLIFRLNDAKATGQSMEDFIVELGAIGFPFRVIVDDGTDLSKFGDAFRTKNKFFAGFISDVGHPVKDAPAATKDSK